MKLQKEISIKEVATLIQADIRGDSGIKISGINEIHKAEAGDLVYVDNEKYYQSTLNSPASVIIINKEADIPEGKALLVCDNPFYAYKKLVEMFMIREEIPDETYKLHPTSQVGIGTRIYPDVFIGNHVSIGKDCIIHPHVAIHTGTIIGDRVIIKANSVIGGDAFYYNKSGDQWTKWPSCGRVIIQDDVHIGANVCIDKGVSGDTMIGRQTKIDNQVQIAHGVVIGERCLLASQVGIAGKTIIGDDVTIYGQVGINKAITIGSKAVILGKSAITKSVKGNTTYFGIPAREVRIANKELASLRSLPDMIKKMEALIKKDK